MPLLTFAILPFQQRQRLMLLDGNARINLSTFYHDFRDQQIFVPWLQVRLLRC